MIQIAWNRREHASFNTYICLIIYLLTEYSKWLPFCENVRMWKNDTVDETRTMRMMIIGIPKYRGRLQITRLRLQKLFERERENKMLHSLIEFERTSVP